MDKVKVAAEDKNSEGGLFAVKALADTRDPAAEAYVVAMLPIVMEKYADKVQQLFYSRHMCIFCCEARDHQSIALA